MGWYLLLWGIFTFLMFFATLRLNKGLQVVFLSLTLLFFLLSIGDFTGNSFFTKLGGWVGIFCGTSAIYCSLAQVINEAYGKTKMPV